MMTRPHDDEMGAAAAAAAAAGTRVEKEPGVHISQWHTQARAKRTTALKWWHQQNRSRKLLIILVSVWAVIMLLEQLTAWAVLIVSAHAATLRSCSSTSQPCAPSPTSNTSVCHVKARKNGDSALAIRETFEACGYNPDGARKTIVFDNSTYTIKTVMNTTGLSNVDIQLHGTLSWDNSDIDYWLNASLPVGYQNQSTAWLLGGENITVNGYGYGTFNGNGQAWYDFVNGASNYPRRPHQLTITGTKNSVFEGINFLNSQMWTMTVIHSSDVLLQDIYVNNTSKNGASAINTDGADTLYANNITFRRWTVDNGDDAISPKANSTNILIEDSTFYTGSGIALGSIGQNYGAYEVIQNVTCRNITAHRTKYGAYIKTWTGVQKGYPPNGGGGGIGHASNLTFTNFTLYDTQQMFAITQCTSYNGQKGLCDTSKFNIHDVYLNNFTGTDNSDVVVTLQCSGAAPCYNIQVQNVEVENISNHTMPKQYQCDSVEQAVGFNCTGPPDGENNAI